MEEIGIALVGCGRAGMVHARNFAGRIPGARLVSLIDPARDAASSAARELGIADFSTDVRDALKNSRVHALVVATPTANHRDIVVEAARSGRHALKHRLNELGYSMKKKDFEKTLRKRHPDKRP